MIYQCSVPGTVAVTFDDGPYIYTQAILDMLNAAGMKVTFFENGNNWCGLVMCETLRQTRR